MVVFASRGGDRERLAMAAAVGVVEAHGEIRLRRLPNATADSLAEAPWLAKEYVPPRDADVAWADALIFVAPPWLEASSAELQNYFATLAGLRGSGLWTLRTVAVIAEGATREALEGHFSALGLKPLAASGPGDTAGSAEERARLVGKAVGTAAGAR